MDLSPDNIAAAAEAIRVPALEARLALLDQGAALAPARLDLFACARPSAGADGYPAVLTIAGAATALLETGFTVNSGTLDTDLDAATDLSGVYADRASFLAAIEALSGVAGAVIVGSDLVLTGATLGALGTLDLTVALVVDTVQVSAAIAQVTGSAIDPPVVAIDLTAGAGVVVDETDEDVRSVRIEIDAPIEGQVTGADPATGSIPLWARFYRPNGDWWADVSCSVEGGDGELQLAATGTEGEPPVSVARLFQGAYARLSSVVIAG